MKKIVLGLATSLALSSAAIADPAMWRVSDADSEIYLFGSVHVLKPTTEWRTGTLDDALTRADEIYFELPMTAEAQAASQSLIPQFGLNQPGQPLRGMLSTKENEQLVRVAGQYGLPAAQLDPLQPWLVSVTLSMMALQGQGYNPMSGVELTLAGEIDDSRERFFETYADQFGFFAGLSRDIQVDFLTVTMEQIEENPTALDELVDAWAAGDVSALDQIFHDGMRETDQEVYDVLILNRNVNWADQIETLMSGSGSAVIVVGAGHLVGENGVPNMLTERGYSVERVQ